MIAAPSGGAQIALAAEAPTELASGASSDADRIVPDFSIEQLFQLFLWLTELQDGGGCRRVEAGSLVEVAQAREGLSSSRTLAVRAGALLAILQDRERDLS